MPDSDLAGTPGWRERLEAAAEAFATGRTALIGWFDGNAASLAADLRAALAAAPQEGGGGTTPTPWAEPYGSDPTFLAADEAVTTLARSLCLTASEAECMQRGGHELWRLGWRPAGVQVDREALRAAVVAAVESVQAAAPTAASAESRRWFQQGVARTGNAVLTALAPLLGSPGETP